MQRDYRVNHILFGGTLQTDAESPVHALCPKVEVAGTTVTVVCIAGISVYWDSLYGNLYLIMIFHV